jgi:hypothetical protein
MKLLLDECLPLDFRHNFPGHDASTAQWAGLKSKKNGELLRAAEVGDQGLEYQQNLAGRKLSIISIRSKTNQLEDLLPFIDAILDALKTISAGEVIRID